MNYTITSCNGQSLCFSGNGYFSQPITHVVYNCSGTLLFILNSASGNPYISGTGCWFNVNYTAKMISLLCFNGNSHFTYDASGNVMTSGFLSVQCVD